MNLAFQMSVIVLIIRDDIKAGVFLRRDTCLLHSSTSVMPGVKSLRVLLLTGAALFTIAALTLFAFRLAYPFEVEWQEGGMLDHVVQLDEGRPLYCEPSSDFIPFIYPPIYYLVTWAFSQVFSISFFTGRLVSVLASLATAWLIFGAVKRRTGSLGWAFAAGSFFFALYPVTAFWFDLVRVDSLALLLIVAAFCFSTRERAWAPFAVGGCLLLAFLTKQTAAIFIVFTVLYYLVNSRRKLLYFTATLVVLGGLFLLLAGGDGRRMFFYYAFTVPAQHGVDGNRVKIFFVNDLFAKISFLIALLIFASAPDWSDLKTLWTKLTKSSLVFFLGAAALSSFMTRLHWGSAANARLHLYVFVVVAVFFMMTPGRLARLRDFANAVFVILILQLAVFAYNPVTMIPTAGDRAAGEGFLNTVRGIHGKVLIPDHGFYATLAGKSRSYHSMAFFDTHRQNEPGSLARKAIEDIEQKLRSHYWNAVFVDPDRQRLFMTMLERYYTKSRPVFSDRDSFFTFSGLRTRPEWIYRPRR